MIPVTAAGGVIYRERANGPEVLLIFRKGVWDLPKGKKEENESEEECAVREVREETGSPPPEILKKIGTTYHEYERKGTTYGKTTHWYAMRIPPASPLTPQQEEGIEQVRWIHLAEAPKMVGFDNLQEVLQRFEKLWNAG